MLLPETLRLLLPDGSITRILLEDYLRGVVAAALAADAPLEAQKALAVAARTFAANTHRHSERGADVCTTRHCQAWNERANPRAARAVMETRGIVATFNDQLIEAFYFAHCDGKTRDAKGVLMDAPAYLKSVSCPCGFAALKGHGIGMCLRGMMAMARLGESSDFILKHYYSGVALQQLESDKSTRGLEPIAPPKKPSTDLPPLTAKPRTIVSPVSRGTTPHPPTTHKTEKPAHETKPPRRAYRKKIEQPPPVEEPRNLTTEPSNQPTTPLSDPRLWLDVHSPEADDLTFFLAVEDVAPTTVTSLQSPVSSPPSSMPEELPSAWQVEMFAPPASMPEELPSAIELDFIAPPTNLPEDELGAPPPEFLQPAAHIIEPDLADFIPPVEKFYTPLDAPPTMPEALPTFDAAATDETPFAWVPPPPMEENAFGVKQTRVLMDSLPGPRVIAGNLPKAGMLVTIRDARGNSIVTVSGVAQQYGAGGFEAPLTDDGAYHVKFDGAELDVRLENETVFIYYN